MRHCSVLYSWTGPLLWCWCQTGFDLLTGAGSQLVVNVDVDSPADVNVLHLYKEFVVSTNAPQIHICFHPLKLKVWIKKCCSDVYIRSKWQRVDVNIWLQMNLHFSSIPRNR